MGAFIDMLAAASPSRSTWKHRRFLFVPYDQLSDRIGPLSREPSEQLGICVVENPWKAARRPYHRQKLALVLSNLRHFAIEQARRGVAVAHLVHDGPYREALGPFAQRHGPLRVMRPAERELRADLAPLVSEGAIEYVPHEGWLTTADEFQSSQPQGSRWRMDAFYRHVRKKHGWLMEGERPLGDRYSFDAENRKRWTGTPPPPAPPRFAPDDVTREVGALVETHFARHPGRLDLEALPATGADAETLAQWAVGRCLEHFGPYEDAMSTRSSGLFHTRLSPLINIHRILPRDIVDAALASPAPLASREAILRQVVGWREYMHHVHVATDGFRTLADGSRVPCAAHPGDGGFERWSGVAWARGKDDAAQDGGATPSYLDAHRPLPPALWGTPSGLACLDHVVADVWSEAWSHHITRLMVIANLSTLLEVAPRAITDWFWVAYQDAYDWVVEPNVLGMGSFGLGELFMTKPYICGAAYIDRMSDFCSGCAFDPKRNCPITALYWAFLDRNAPLLDGNARLAMPLRSARKRSPALREHDRQVFMLVSETLGDGRKMSPADLPAHP